MRARIENFRGVRRVEFEFGKNITLLAGPNGAGKSSMCEAVALLMTGQMVPNGLPKTRAHVLVNRTTGREGASVTVWDKGFEAELAWPGCKLTTAGERPACSLVAAGLVRPAHYIGQEGRELWAKLLKVEVTATDFAVALERRGIELPPKTHAEMVGMISKEGAQKTYLYLKERIAELKGGWEQISQAGRWGQKKAEEYRPVGLRTGMDREHEVKNLEDLRAKMEKMRARHTLSSVDREAKLARIGGKKEAIRAAEDASSALGEAERALESLPALQERTPIPCPHCGRPLDLIFSHRGAQAQIVAMPEKTNLPAEEAKAIRLRRQAAEGDLAKAREAVATANREVEEIAADEAWLRQNPETTSAGVVQEMRVLEDEIATLVRDIGAFDRWNEAHAKQRQIILASECLDICDPAGPIASEKIGVLVGHLNAVLETVRRSAGYGEIRIDRADDGIVTVMLNGLIYALLSAGEQATVDVALQLALATVDGSTMVIMDHLEALDDLGWDGAIKALHDSPFTALVAYTQYARKRMPPLADAGYGAAYWIDRGEIVPEGRAAI